MHLAATDTDDQPCPRPSRREHDVADDCAAKSPALIQSCISLVTVVLVVARAVNTLR